MMNLKNTFNQFKLGFEEYKESFKKYEESNKKHLNNLKELTGRDDPILTKDKKPTDRYISHAERDMRINRKRYSSYEAAITKIDNYMDNLEYGDNLDNSVDFINELQSIIDALPQRSAIFPKKNLSSTPLIQQAVWSLYNNKKEMDDKFCNLNAQYLQFTEIANETLQMMNGSRLSDCFSVSENNSVLVEQIAVLDSVNSSSNDNSLFNAFENSGIYGGCDIYFGYQYCV